MYHIYTGGEAKHDGYGASCSDKWSCHVAADQIKLIHKYAESPIFPLAIDS